MVAGQAGRPKVVRLEFGEMSALECVEQVSPRTCAVKAPHIASLTTKAFFGKCQRLFRGGQAVSVRLGWPPMTQRRFPPPWSVEEQEACFVVRDHNGQTLDNGPERTSGYFQRA